MLRLLILLSFITKIAVKIKNYSIVTKCKYEFKIASNPCKITKRREEKRREEKISAQLFLCSCFF